MLENLEQTHFNFLMFRDNKKSQIFRYQTLTSEDIFIF